MGVETTNRPLRYEDLQAIAERFNLNSQQKESLFGIKRRTQARYKRDNPQLSPVIADRLARFERLSNLATQVFEDEQEAKRWLSSPKASLDGQTPLDALATDRGATQVEQMLYRIEYGVYG